MNDVSRVCSQCGGKVALEVRFCGRCGYDTSAGLPVEQRKLPAQLATAAVPVVAGLASWALRAGWKLLQSRLEEAAQNPPAPQQREPPPRQRSQPSTGERPRRTVRIRSPWAVGDANGVWRQGTQEHIIDFDE